MNPEALRRQGPEIFGYGWQSKLARLLRRYPQTIRRWLHGDSPIPHEIDLLFDLWKRHGINQ
jgi:hypothetical protein